VVVSSSPKVVSWLVASCGESKDPHLVLDESWRGVATSENRSPTPVMAGDDGVYASLQPASTHSCCSRGKPNLGIPDETIEELSGPLEGIGF
jgi:hypothetical protein